MAGRPEDGRALIAYFENLLRALEKSSRQKEANCLLRRYERPVRRAIRDAFPCKNRILWMFCGKKRRQTALSALNYLYDVRFLGLGPEAEAVLKKE